MSGPVIMVDHRDPNTYLPVCNLSNYAIMLMEPQRLSPKSVFWRLSLSSIGVLDRLKYRLRFYPTQLHITEPQRSSLPVL